MHEAPHLDDERVARLRAIAAECRADAVRAITAAQSGHPGGSLSAVDILVSLFHGEMRHRPAEPSWADRDRFVLSKGHGVPALYAVLASCGYLPREELTNLRRLGSRLQGHPARHLFPPVEASTGSLGQGLSIAQGMALASKLDGDRFRVYALVGDGESQEGQIWEAALSAGRYRLDTLCAFLDYNKAQIDGLVKDVLDLEPVADKWRAFGWHVVTIDGHDLRAIAAALAEARATKGKPTMIVAHTIKGKGAKLFEADLVKWHGVAPTEAQAAEVLAELAKGGAR